ncbi:MAG: hydrogenase 3 maturation endopeptidase HyCI, partial [SAR324 cluster bacterium]|nr:hydrogenase 3 maturation endopeptidase HyCI [SAR324 cluster bacterium]
RILREAKKTERPVLVVGIGAELRADDFVGVLVAREVQARNLPFIKGIEACAAPENFTGEIINANPSLVIFLDAANLGLKAGAMRLIKREEIQGMSFCTHTLPLYLILDYLSLSLDCNFLVLGIQPKDISVMGEQSPEIITAVSKLVNLLASAS